MRVTLEDTKTGETLVIEQKPDGKISCEERPDKPRAKRNERKAERPSPPSEAAATEKTAPKSSSAAEPEGERSDGGATAKKTAKRKTPARRGTSLKWSPVKDHGYHGFRAPSGGGYFKVLKAKATQWALFFEPAGADARHVGCFGKDEPAKTKAQELHDKGWPASEVRGVTAEDVAHACPAPETEGEGRKTRMKRETKTETKAETTTPSTPTAPAPAAANEPPPPAASEAEKDKELMGSFTGELDNVLDEDEEGE